MKIPIFIFNPQSVFKKRMKWRAKGINVTGMAPLKGSAVHNGKKPPFLFLFSSFLVKLKALAQALQTFGRTLQSFLNQVLFSFDAYFLELEEIIKRALLEVETEAPQ